MRLTHIWRLPLLVQRAANPAWQIDEPTDSLRPNVGRSPAPTAVPAARSMADERSNEAGVTYFGVPWAGGGHVPEVRLPAASAPCGRTHPRRMLSVLEYP